MNPVPTIPSEWARRDRPLSQYAARTAEAAVRAAEMIELSRMAKGYPVSWRLSTRTAEVRAQEQHGGRLGACHLRPVALDRCVRGPAGAADEQPMRREELAARLNGL